MKIKKIKLAATVMFCWSLGVNALFIGSQILYTSIADKSIKKTEEILREYHSQNKILYTSTAEKIIKKTEEILREYHSQDSIKERTEVQRDYLFKGRAEEYVQEAIRYYEQCFPVLTEESKERFLAGMDKNDDRVISELEAKLALERYRQDANSLKECVK